MAAMALFGTLSTLRAQAHLHGSIETGLAYLESLFRNGSEERLRLASVQTDETRRIELGGGVFALEQAYLSKDPAEGRWESHRAYIDIQAVVTGEEFMGVCDVSRLAVNEDLSPGKDLLFYHPFEGGSRLRIQAGEAAIFFPVDAHMPCLRTGTSPTLVRKSVVKVPVF